MDNPSFGGEAPVCVVGNVNRDIKLSGIPQSTALGCDGETSVGAIIETIGGGGANSACAAAALGAKVRFMGKTGNDALAQQIQHAMEMHGVTTFFKRDAHIQTGSSVALDFSDGHRHFLSCLPNNESLSFDDLDLSVLDGCSHLLRADVWFSIAMLEGGNRRLFTEARRRGLATSVDINFDPQWNCGDTVKIARRKRLLRDTLDLVDTAHGNVRELMEFTDAPDLDSALIRLTDLEVKSVVVHQGAQGAGYYAGGQWIHEPADPAQEIVHSTGTGDLLSICMILLNSRNDMPPAEKLRISNRIVREYIEGSRDIIPRLS
jgi:sugar/nucleoside kinase (ribokinase family)